MNFIQIMAGGLGKRMGNTSMPKQFLMLGKKPTIIHTIEKFTLMDSFDKIIVSCPKAWIQYTSEIVAKYITDQRIVIIEGGKERNDTLNNAINYIEQNYSIGDNDTLMVHDAVRPFVTRRIIYENLKLIENFAAVDTCIPAFDTIVRAENGIVIDIPNRDEMYQGQTPQTFKIKKFKESYNNLTKDQKNILTDSCKICLLNGEKIGIVEGEISNIKITTPYDLKIANAILEERKIWLIRL